jgi:hypothetical protein
MEGLTESSDLQSCVVAAQRLSYQVRLDVLLGLIGAELELEPLPQTIRGLLNTILKAWHLRFAPHDMNEINQTISRTP